MMQQSIRGELILFYGRQISTQNIMIGFKPMIHDHNRYSQPNLGRTSRRGRYPPPLGKGEYILLKALLGALIGGCAMAIGSWLGVIVELGTMGLVTAELGTKNAYRGIRPWRRNWWISHRVARAWFTNQF